MVARRKSWTPIKSAKNGGCPRSHEEHLRLLWNPPARAREAGIIAVQQRLIGVQKTDGCPQRKNKSWTPINSAKNGGCPPSPLVMLSRYARGLGGLQIALDSALQAQDLYQTAGGWEGKINGLVAVANAHQALGNNRAAAEAFYRAAGINLRNSGRSPLLAKILWLIG